MSPLLFELRFGSYLVYSPRGVSHVSTHSRRVRDAVKAGVETSLRRIAEHLAAELEDHQLDRVLGRDVTLVPAPRSSVLGEGALWPAERVARELLRNDLGSTVVPCLHRVEPVPKSAYQPSGKRPTALRQYQTMSVERQLVATERIALVDDFVTKGNTLLGGASRLKRAFPEAEVRAFALIRTLGFQLEIDHLVDPCLGTIRAEGEAARRNP